MKKVLTKEIANLFQDTRHDTKRQLRLRNGLITRHAYSVTGLARVRGQLGESSKLIILNRRNGRTKDWGGITSEVLKFL